MAVAKFHSFRGQKSALVLVKANKFQMVATPAYVPKEAVEGIKEGEEFTIPDGYRLAPMVDAETGEARTTESGAQLHTLVWGEA